MIGPCLARHGLHPSSAKDSLIGRCCFSHSSPTSPASISDPDAQHSFAARPELTSAPLRSRPRWVWVGVSITAMSSERDPSFSLSKIRQLGLEVRAIATRYDPGRSCTSLVPSPRSSALPPRHFLVISRPTSLATPPFKTSCLRFLSVLVCDRQNGSKSSATSTRSVDHPQVRFW